MLVFTPVLLSSFPPLLHLYSRRFSRPFNAVFSLPFPFIHTPFFLPFSPLVSSPIFLSRPPSLFAHFFAHFYVRPRPIPFFFSPFLLIFMTTYTLAHFYARTLIFRHSHFAHFLRPRFYLPRLFHLLLHSYFPIFPAFPLLLIFMTANNSRSHLCPHTLFTRIHPHDTLNALAFLPAARFFPTKNEPAQKKFRKNFSKTRVICLT